MKRHRSQSFFFITKFHLLRLRKGVNSSKFLIKLETKILSELLEINPKLMVLRTQSQKLILRPSDKHMQLSALRRVELTWKILQTRGQMRWLCYSLFSPVMGDAYQITRARLLTLIGRNWSKFSNEVLSCLSLSNEDASQLERISFHQYMNSRTTRAFDFAQTYLLEGDYSRRLIYGRDMSFHNLTLSRIIRWNSSCAVAFIKRSATLKDSVQLQKFFEFFPDFQELLNSRASLEFVFHPQSHESFDQRLGHSALGVQDKFIDVEIWHQRFIIKNNTWLLIDSTCSPSLEFVAGHWQFLEQNKVEQRKVEILRPRETSRVTLDEGIFLMGRVDENWYHLLLDTLPRYLLIRGIDPEVPVLIRGDLPQTSKTFIERLVEREIIYVFPEDLVFVRTLYFVPARSTVYDSVPVKNQERVSYSPVIIQKQREWILQSFPLKKSQVYPVKIFLSRRASYRNLLNIEAVSRLLKRSDFQVVEPNESFYLNQARFFSEANTVFSPGGAILANIIFMRRGSRVISIRSWRGSDVPLWKLLSEACEVNHSEVVGIPSYFGLKSLLRAHSNYYVPLNRIKKELSA
jgi:hypothetical protein